jgi:hypothetical protein
LRIALHALEEVHLYAVYGELRFMFKDWIGLFQHITPALQALVPIIVSIASLVLSILVWREQRPRLRLSVMSDAVIISDNENLDENNLVILTVTNRGKEPTLLTAFMVYKMSSWWRRIFKKPDKEFYIPNPQPLGGPRNIPYELKPAHIWRGIYRRRVDIIENIHDGTYYIGVETSHRDKPYLKLVRKPKDTSPLSK